ncbi:MAG: phosphoribosylformylglycinamidine synthase I [Chloroflexi bacterium RBG_13_54_9]|nr:MAG: phosphoribosylformylglycinamidine synthase I [Chloroflexi bacterium RBG_13_54_9]
MGKVRTLVLRVAGTNCDQETAYAFQLVGSEVELVHINQLFRREKRLSDYHILAAPGGFAYGDDISAGKALANELKSRLADQIRQFIDDGKLILGVCNGFQALAKAGCLPGIRGSIRQEITLFNSDTGTFQCRWLHLKVPDNSRCVFTKGLSSVIQLPMANGEGKFVPADDASLQEMKANGQIVLQYCDPHGELTPESNPNGSVEAIAGICDPTGRVFALMPHPERHIHPTHHPRWTREGLKKEGDGVQIFRNAVEYAAKL